jgi:ribose 1,5-bisphosphate isomerase
MNINKKIKKLILDIKNLKIQGATNVCLATLDILKLITEQNQRLALNQFLRETKKFAEKASLIRATEPMAQNAIRYVFFKLKNQEINNTPEAINLIYKYTDEFIKLLKENKKQLFKKGTSLIKKKNKIFTHCHSSAVENILINSKSKKIKVFNTETRPLFQGRITAQKLTQAGIDTTMLVDSAADFFISKHSGEELMMDKVIIGCDSISWDGSVVNKIGSYGIGLAAKYNKIPLYIAGNLFKVDSDNIINIEIREDSEVWKKKDKKHFDIINFSFDYVPAEFITGIICEFGIIKPSEVKKIVLKKYPWLIKK